MKKLLITILSLTVVSAGAFAAKYKVNTGGKVVSPTGHVQQNSTVISPQPAYNNFYNNYYSQNYVSTKQVLATPAGTIDIVMDYSGSMSYWIEAAKNSMAAIISQLPNSTKVGFRVFGHDGGNNPYSPVLNKVKCVMKNKNGKYKVKTQTASYLGSISGSCSATAQVTPVASHSASTLINGMNSVQIGGSTPLTLALEQAVTSDFGAMPRTQPKKIILITDGGENCGGDPCAFAKTLVAQRKDITIDVVLVSSNSKELICLAQTTGGKFYNTDDVYSFTNVLIDSMQNTSPAPSTEPEPTQQYEFIGN